MFFQPPFKEYGRGITILDIKGTKETGNKMPMNLPGKGCAS
jgi:hypothetical protein